MARPRGFATWNPKAETEALLANVHAVLAEYEDHLPLTARQIFYRLVGQYDFDKTEQAYARLCEALVRARRSGRVPFDPKTDLGGGEQVVKIQLHGCPRNGTMGQCYVADPETGSFIGMVSLASLTPVPGSRGLKELKA